jgi:hypothetical protein
VSEQDDIGSRGELLALLHLSDRCYVSAEGVESYFSTVLLGAKYPTVDLLVQLKHVGRRLLFFAAQVKATDDVPVRSASRLPIAVSAADIARLLESTLPTYLIGVDEPNGKVYLLAVTRRLRGGIRTFPRTHELTPTNLRLLWDEVQGYWERSTRPRWRSRFTE